MEDLEELLASISPCSLWKIANSRLAREKDKERADAALLLPAWVRGAAGRRVLDLQKQMVQEAAR